MIGVSVNLKEDFDGNNKYLNKYIGGYIIESTKKK